MGQVQVAVSSKTAKRALIASLIGSSIEWFDYFLYGTVASLVFNKIFFPNFDPVVGLLLSYLSFALPFFIRPLGGIVFSHIGDKIGRKKTLVLTLSLMGGATVLIGLLPDYQAIGVWAPILLITMRCIQGLESAESGEVPCSWQSSTRAKITAVSSAAFRKWASLSGCSWARWLYP